MYALKYPYPVLNRSGPTVCRPCLPTPTGGQPDLFDWRRGAEVIPQRSAVVKVVVSSNYSARTQTTYTLPNSSTLTCYSDFSVPKAFTFDRSNGGLSVYPNPATTGSVTIETIEDLKNADVSIFSLSGQELFSTQVPALDERKAIDVSGLAQGIYLIRVRSAGFRHIQAHYHQQIKPFRTLLTEATLRRSGFCLLAPPICLFRVDKITLVAYL